MCAHSKLLFLYVKNIKIIKLYVCIHFRYANVNLLNTSNIHNKIKKTNFIIFILYFLFDAKIER